jgi:hypothetical protein
MKKTLLTIAVAMVVAAGAYAQGTINFVNTAGSLILYNGASATAANGVKIELLAAAPGTTDTSLFTLIGAAVNVGTPTAGRFSGGVRTINGITAGGAAAIYVRAYVGADFATALYSSVSPILALPTTGNPLTVPAGTPSALIDSGFAGLNVTVPEPSSMAIAGLGAASLLMFRRRK